MSWNWLWLQLYISTTLHEHFHFPGASGPGGPEAGAGNLEARSVFPECQRRRFPVCDDAELAHQDSSKWRDFVHSQVCIVCVVQYCVYLQLPIRMVIILMVCLALHLHNIRKKMNIVQGHLLTFHIADCVWSSRAWWSWATTLTTARSAACRYPPVGYNHENTPYSTFTPFWVRIWNWSFLSPPYVQITTFAGGALSYFKLGLTFLFREFNHHIISFASPRFLLYVENICSF